MFACYSAGPESEKESGREGETGRQRGGEDAARASSRSFHGNFYQIFTIIPSGLDSATVRERERERKRDRAELYDGRAVNCLAPSLPLSVSRSVIAFLHCHSGRQARERKNLPTLSLLVLSSSSSSSSLLMHAIQYVQSPAPFFLPWRTRTRNPGATNANDRLWTIFLP